MQFKRKEGCGRCSREETRSRGKMALRRQWAKGTSLISMVLRTIQWEVLAWNQRLKGQTLILELRDVKLSEVENSMCI